MPGEKVETQKCVEPETKPFNQGVYVCERLNFGLNGKGPGEMPLLPTGFGKSDRPG